MEYEPQQPKQAWGEIGETALPRNPIAAPSAVQGGLLLAKTWRDRKPLELALDLALEHVMSHAGAPLGSTPGRATSSRKETAGSARRSANGRPRALTRRNSP